MVSPAASQVPAPGELVLDHVAHFVPHVDARAAALEKLGFTLTPFSAQSHRLEPGGPLVPAGTGNRCMMLQHGYLEFLTPTGDTPIANQLRTAIKRYAGAHLVAFGTAAPEADHARLAKSGFAPLDAGRPAARDRHGARPGDRALHRGARPAGHDAGRPHPVLPAAHAGVVVAAALDGTRQPRGRVWRA